MPHQPGHIGGFAQLWIAHYVQICEARQAERLPDPVPSGFLDVAEELRAPGDSQSGKQGQNTGGSVLRFRGKAVRPLIVRGKRGVPLGNDVSLAGKPNAIPFNMGE